MYKIINICFFFYRSIMTVKKGNRSGGLASIVTRQKLYNSNQQLDIGNLSKSNTVHSYNIIVGFNEKDQLQLITKDESSEEDAQKLSKDTKTGKHENVSIDDIADCTNINDYPNCENTLVFYITKNTNKEAIALRFKNEQDFKRIYFTYKYFKMRNRLTRNTTNYFNNDTLFSKKKTADSYRINSIDDYNQFDKTRSDFDLMQTTDNDGVTHLSVHQKGSRFDQPLSLIGLRNERDTGEIDSVIYTDIEIPSKPEKKRLFHKKAKAPPPPILPINKDTPKVLKGEFVRVNVERSPDVVPKENKQNKIPDILMLKDNKSKKTSPNSNLWTVSNKGKEISLFYDSSAKLM